jgi:hypothetical protein
MGRAYSVHGEVKTYTKFWFEILKGRDHSKYLVVDGRIKLQWILGKCRY